MVKQEEKSEPEPALSAEETRHYSQIAALFEHAPAAIAMLRGPTHIFELANPKYNELVDGRLLIGRTVRDAFPELSGQGYYELLDTVARTGRPHIGRAQSVFLRRGADAAPEERFMDFVFQPIQGDNERESKILVVAFEVTDLVKARLKAEAGEHLLRTFIDNLPELAWTALPDGHIDYYNRRWYEYTGTTFDEMQGWGWEKVHDPELLPKVLARWKKSLETGEPFEMEFTLRGADGIPRWFLTRVAPSRDAAGRIARWFGTNTNINDLKLAQALSVAVAEQSRDAQRMIIELRTAKELAESRLAAIASQAGLR